MKSPDEEPLDPQPDGDSAPDPGSSDTPSPDGDPETDGDTGAAEGADDDNDEGTDEPLGESAWELPAPVASAWVGFWPHPDAPTRDEVGRAVASWVGREVEMESIEPDEEEGMLWALVVNIPGVNSSVGLWAGRALNAESGQLDDSAMEAWQLEDPAMAACKWVVGMQTELEPGEAHAEYFHLMAMLAGSLPDLTGILDVSNARRWPRQEIEEQFLSADAVPNDESLWTITAVATSDEDDVPMMLFTTGLLRCGLPELEMLEVPARHSQAAAILLNHVASLLLEAPPPEPEEPIEIGPDIFVTLIPWQECARYIAEETPGSTAFRETAREQGDGSLMAVRAVICSAKKRGSFKQLWAWPTEIIESMEAGRAVLYASEHSAAATERRAQRTWPKFATAFASVRRAEEPDVLALATTAFQVQAPLGSVDEHDRREQGWFTVQRFDHDVVDAILSEEPVTRQDLHVGDAIRIPRAEVTDWRVFLPEEVFGPARSDALLAAVDRLRGLA